MAWGKREPRGVTVRPVNRPLAQMDTGSSAGDIRPVCGSDSSPFVAERLENQPPELHRAFPQGERTISWHERYVQVAHLPCGCCYQALCPGTLGKRLSDEVPSMRTARVGSDGVAPPPRTDVRSGAVSHTHALEGLDGDWG
jgi:hypothetical protein